MSQQLASDNCPLDSGQGKPLLRGSQSHSPPAPSQTHPSVMLAWDSGYPRAKFYCPRSRVREKGFRIQRSSHGPGGLHTRFWPRGLECSWGVEREEEAVSHLTARKKHGILVGRGSNTGDLPRVSCTGRGEKHERS